MLNFAPGCFIEAGQWLFLLKLYTDNDFWTTSFKVTLINPIQDGLFGVCSRTGQQKGPFLKSVTHILQ